MFLHQRINESVKDIGMPDVLHTPQHDWINCPAIQVTFFNTNR